MTKQANSIIQMPLSVNKWKFILWMFIVTILMLFASQTSAYLVRRAEGNWLQFNIPVVFWYSSAVLFASSLTMQLALWAAKKDNLGLLKAMTCATFILGIAFLAMQWQGWVNLVDQDVYFVGNPSGSFMYLFTGLHALHLISGLVVLIFALFAAFRSKINGKNLLQIEICTTYWHFLDALWIYLLVFLVYFR